jgi:DNA repair photolyase
MTRWYHKGEKWGSFVDVKIGIDDILTQEVEKKHRGIVLLSSVTDPYQPIERKTKLTRKLLNILSDHDFQVEILTKSSLVTRDIDVISMIDMCEVGLTITMWDDDARRVFEPNASSISERLDALKVLRENGIDTYVFLGPLLPFFSEKNFDKLINSIAENVNRVLVDRLNLKAGNWGNIKTTLQNHYPDMIDKFKLASDDESMYYSRLRGKVRSLLEDRMIPSDILF